MRIAYLCADPGIPVDGRKGASIHLRSVVHALAARGAEVTVIAARADREVPHVSGAAEVRLLPRLPRSDVGARERALVAANATVEAALEELGPFDLVYERHALFAHAAMAHAARTGVPGVLEVNTPLVDEQAEHRVLASPAAAEHFARASFADATRIVATSRPVAAYVTRLCPEAKGRIAVIPNGADPVLFRPRQGHRSNRFTVGFVGSLKPWHGLATLADAFALLHAAHPRSRLLIVGDGPGRTALQDALGARGVLSVTEFTGAVEHREVAELLARMDAAVAPYEPLPTFYFSPLKLYEYMAAGLPVVASDIGEIGEVLDDGKTGLLCPPGDPAALAGALLRVARDPGLAKRLGRAARRQAATRHTWDAVVTEILAAAETAPAGVA